MNGQAFTRISQTLQTECGLDPARLLVVGFSGGPDSAALLHALHAAGWPLLAAHLDHGLRPQSVAEADAAERAAASLGAPFVRGRAAVAERAAGEGMSIEEAARAARYEFLFREAEQHDAQAVVVAHTADDQAETILMHLLRGAGPDGLHGMPARWQPNAWSASIPLVRPLLLASRAEVLAYCAQHGLQPLYDPSNQDPAFFRNRLRNELLPLMESYAPGFKRRLQQTGELLAGDSALLDALAQQAWQRCLAQRGPGYLGLHRAALLAEPLALQRALVRRAAAELRVGRDVGYADVHRALDALAGEEGAVLDWFGGLFILLEGETAWFAEQGAPLPEPWPQAPEAELHLEVPAELHLGAGWQLCLAEAAPQADLRTDPYQAWLDADAAGTELVLRRQRPGDRLQPFGMQGSQKLSDLFVNEKLPRRARAAWPLLCRGEEIIWVPGLRLAEPYRVHAGTRRVLHAKVEVIS